MLNAEPIPLFGRRIIMRNCGRFVHVSADFGSEYTTHAHLSCEMLYAGLTRERSRVPKDFGDAMSGYRFHDHFDLSAFPIWFTVGVLANSESKNGGHRQIRDTHTFNSLIESAPGVQTNNKLPKYGTIESILPDQRFATFAVSPRQEILNDIALRQVFWMGKKRSMFQIMELGDVLSGQWETGACFTPAIQIGPEDVAQFDAMQVLAATQRYLVVEGHLRNASYVAFGPYGTIPSIALSPLLTQANA